MRARRAVTTTDNEEKEEYLCEVCGREISKEEDESYDGSAGNAGTTK